MTKKQEQKRTDESKQNKHSETEASNEPEGTHTITIRKYKQNIVEGDKKNM